VASDEEEYTVGYGKPPKSGQFAKGKSGNPKGRPKGSRNVLTEFNEVNRELVRVNINGKARKVTRFKAIHYQLSNQAIAGNLAATKIVVQLQQSFEEPEHGDDRPSVSNLRDQMVIANFLERMQELDDAAVDEPQPSDDSDTEQGKQ
jgi:hypothetical protein